MRQAASATTTYTPFPSGNCCVIDNAINQSGLSTGYSTGDDQATYLAGNPTHTSAFDGFEFFGDGNDIYASA